ncbi:transcriptional regulator [Halococcus qingdaonensis]|uniref:transcriptional regulator n=1 Tax=Halococcus qingdaonensis TaxID=224402 RepID=UPI00211603C3|nr:transcriptional regulator [Halococcus qingdaonensis]
MDDDADEIEPDDVRAELDRQRADVVDDRMDEGLVDLLSRALDTDTRTRVYVYLRRQPESTVEEIATGTGLYPAAVRRVLDEFDDEQVVERHDGDESTYTAARPDELIDAAIDRFRDELEGLFAPRRRERRNGGRRSEPVTIPVEAADDNER